MAVVATAATKRINSIKTGNAFNGNRNGNDLNVNQNNANNHNDNRGWGGSLRAIGYAWISLQ